MQRVHRSPKGWRATPAGRIHRQMRCCHGVCCSVRSPLGLVAAWHAYIVSVMPCDFVTGGVAEWMHAIHSMRWWQQRAVEQTVRDVGRPLEPPGIDADARWRSLMLAGGVPVSSPSIYTLTLPCDCRRITSDHAAHVRPPRRCSLPHPSLVRCVVSLDSYGCTVACFLCHHSAP
jgi:hypothetical protein